MSQTHPARISDVSRSNSDAPRLAKMGMALTYISLQLYRKVLYLHGSISCAFSSASQMRPAHDLDAFEH